MSGANRYNIKRQAGISPVRSDGSLSSEQVDVNAFEAEKYAARLMGCEFNDAVMISGDGGHDFTFNLSVEVVWLGFYKDTTEPRTKGHLIVNPYEPHRWADIYVVVSGDHQTEFETVGWTTHRELCKRPLKDFGYGEKYAMSTNDLLDINRLLSLKERDDE